MNNNIFRTRFNKFLLYAVAIIISLFFLAPFYFTIVNAVRDVMAPPVLTIQSKPQFVNFVDSIVRIPFLQALKSSLIILFITLSLGLTINFTLGYAFARMQAPLKDLWFGILISLMMIPDVASTIPQYVLFTNFNITNTYWIWILTSLGGSSYYTFLYRQFMQGIPRELEEAARIDGCSTLGIMIRIIAPNTVPVTAVVFMFMFLFNWGDINLPFMYLDVAKWPLAAILHGTYYTLPNNASILLVPLQLSFAILFMIPSVLVYFFGQRYLKEGMITSGLKG